MSHRAVYGGAAGPQPAGRGARAGGQTRSPRPAGRV